MNNLFQYTVQQQDFQGGSVQLIDASNMEE